MKTLRIIRGREAVNYWLGEPFRASQTSHTTGAYPTSKPDEYARSGAISRNRVSCWSGWNGGWSI